MSLVPALSKQSRRGLFRAVAVVCALAMVIYGAVAVTPGPAQAQTVTSGGPYSVTNPGGDLVASLDVAGVAPASESNFITTIWPKSVGLSTGASLSTLFQASWQKYSSTWDAYSTDAAAEFPKPPSFNGGTASVSSDGAGGSTVTIDIPAADVTANVNLPGWIQGILAAAAGFAAAICDLGKLPTHHFHDREPAPGDWRRSVGPDSRGRSDLRWSCHRRVDIRRQRCGPGAFGVPLHLGRLGAHLGPICGLRRGWQCGALLGSRRGPDPEKGADCAK